MDGNAALAMLGFAPVVVFAVWNATRHPDETWQAVGENKTVWITFMLGGYFIAGLGLLVAIVYLVSLRLKLENAAKDLAKAQPVPH